MHLLRRSLLLLSLAVLACGSLARSAIAMAPPLYVTQWGASGAGNGQFSQPSGVAADGSGFIYVTDTGNNRVQKFTTAGAYVGQWGTVGSGNGQFSGPFGLAVANNKVYVVDSGNNRVQVFTTAGAYLSQWGTAGTGNGQFQQPLCAAVDAAGNVYVTDYAQNRVQEFTSTGTYLTQFGSFGFGGGTFNGAAGISIDVYGDIYVADSGNNLVQAFGPGLNYISQIGGGFPITLNYPLGVTTDGVNPYVVDTMDHRMVVSTIGGYQQTQWGTLGTGNGQFNGPHAAVIDGNFVYVADTEQDRIQKFGIAGQEGCEQCIVVADTCCEALPQVGGPWSNILVGTREPTNYMGGNPNVVTIFDLNAPPVPAEDNNWASMTRYNGPGSSWNGDSLGTVFGLTLDEYGNIFVTHTSCYSTDLIGQVFKGGPGAVYRIDAVTGKITTFCKLPNFPDGSVSPPNDLPGLGNITYDCRHQQFFVTDIEDGKIYRIQPVGVNGTTGTVVQTFDPLTADNGLPGWAPIGERLWGIQWHGDRLFYSVWARDGSEGTGPNEIRSVAVNLAGAIVAGSDQHELFVPPLAGRPYSNPVSDISFSAAGKMLLGERSMYSQTSPGAHDARVLEYTCSGGCWVPANSYAIGAYYAKENSAGGVDYDRHAFSGPSGAIGRVWASGDALHLGSPYTDTVYGYQGLRPNLAFGSNLNSMLIDSDGQIISGDKTSTGDVEAPGCPAVTFGTICGQKFNDLNHNGVKDAGEPGIPGWAMQLVGPGGTIVVTTDENGNYCFAELTAGTYTITEIGVSPWIQTAPPGGSYTVNLGGGQNVTGQNFGNYQCTTSGCTQGPPLGIAAWPFDDGAGTRNAADVDHPSPPRNVLQLFGGATIGDGGVSGQALCLTSELDYAKVPYANQAGTAFGDGSFAFDVWVRPNGGVPASTRMIVEKRKLISAAPYRTVGWALYMNGTQCFLEIGNGTTTQVVPGPTLPVGTWSNLAVSVDRTMTPSQGMWYVDGAPQSTGSFTPLQGSVSCTADMYVGQPSPNFGAAPGFQGCIDELQVFATNSSTPVLPAASVGTIHNTGVIGRCPETMVMPSVTTICKTQTSVTVCFNVFNNTATAQSYHWSASGLPIGPGCSVAGPVVFSPPSGTLTVPPFTGSIPVCITIPRPAGLTTQNATSCFAVSLVNDATGRCTTSKSAIRADFTCWCITPPAGVTGVAQLAAGTPIVIGVGHPCDPVALAYQLVPVWLNPDFPDPNELSLNGLPPGEPVIGTLSLTPDGQDPPLVVNVKYPGGYDAAGRYEIVLEADTDGDGVMESIGGALVASTYDSSQTVAVGPATPAIETLQLVAAPNPFLAASAVSFALSRADDVDLGVYDLTGRMVRALQHGRLAAGTHRFEWNGRDDHGRHTAAGVYFIRLETTGRHLESKLVKLN